MSSHYCGLLEFIRILFSLGPSELPLIESSAYYTDVRRDRLDCIRRNFGVSTNDPESRDVVLAWKKGQKKILKNLSRFMK